MLNFLKKLIYDIMLMVIMGVKWDFLRNIYIM